MSNVPRKIIYDDSGISDVEMHCRQKIKRDCTESGLRNMHFSGLEVYVLLQALSDFRQHETHSAQIDFMRSQTKLVLEEDIKTLQTIKSGLMKKEVQE